MPSEEARRKLGRSLQEAFEEAAVAYGFDPADVEVRIEQMGRAEGGEGE